MNAHHKKRTARAEPPPTRPTQFFHGHNDDLKHLHDLVSSVPFSWQLDVVVPSGGTKQLPDEIQQIILRYGSYQYCPQVNLGELLASSPDFGSRYLSDPENSLYALSVESEADADVVCVDGKGRIFANVHKDTYETLGVPGRPSLFGTLGQRFVFEIDSRRLDPTGNKSASAISPKVLDKLRKWPVKPQLAGSGVSLPVATAKTFDLLLTYHSASSDSGEPVALKLPATIPCHTRQPDFSYSDHTSRIPTIDVLVAGPPKPVPPPVSSMPKKRKREPTEWDDVNEFFLAWVGEKMLGLDLDEERDEAEDDRRNSKEGQVVTMSANGFWHPVALRQIVIETQKKITASPSTPFVFFSLHQAPTAPITHISRNRTPPSRKRPNGKRSKRGKGQGGEEERNTAEDSVRQQAALMILLTGKGWAAWRTR